jgi:Winged helix DNA-binding domain
VLFWAALWPCADKRLRGWQRPYAPAAKFPLARSAWPVSSLCHGEWVKRSEALEHRIHAQQLDRPEAERAITDAAVFDFGVQDTGRDGASWALANRGVPIHDAAELEASRGVALAWTLRAAPHFYRRTDLPDVVVATSPLSDRDAAKRVIGADKPLKEAGISTLAGLTEVATQMRRVVTRPMVKGDVSTQLTARLDSPYLRYCRACKATHSWEVPFRIAALYAGLELEPGTSPPVLRRIPDWSKRPPGPAPDPLAGPESLQPIRNYLRFRGPATPNDVAAFLDSPVAEIKAHWPKDAVEVSVDGRQGWILGEIGGIEHDRELLRLLGGFDLFLQGRDRDLIVPDTSRHKELWPILGRPGAVLSGSEIVGSWRPKTAGNGFTLRLCLWGNIAKRIRGQLEDEAERLAAHRGLALAEIVEE